jgi:hypothetical protein
VARAFLDVFAGRPGLVQVCSSDNWTGGFFETSPSGLDAAVNYAQQLDAGTPAGIYVRTTTLVARPGPGKRGGASDTAAAPFLWSDVDFGEVGHKGEALPPDQACAEKVLADSNLPAPTIVVHSGGGLYGLWVLDRPVEKADAAGLSVAVQEALAAASARHGWTYGTGVGDLARVIRLPGSVNRKVPGLPRPCLVIGGSNRAVAPTELPRPVVRPAPAVAGNVGSSGTGPFDALDRSASWGDVLEPAGWTFVGSESDGAERWLRPGDATSSYSARAWPNALVVFSESAGLPTGADQKLTRGRVFAWLPHGGDVTAAARDLLDAAHGRPATSAATGLPEAVLAEIRALPGPSERDAATWARLGVDVASVPLRSHEAAPSMSADGAAAEPWSLYDAIGMEPFDPRGGESDQALAEAVLARVFPVMRYSVDTGSWLIRHPEVWKDRRDDTAGRTWALTKLIPLMPAGDPTKPSKGEAPTPEQRQAARRARFQSSAGAAAIGARIRALVADHHPLTVETATLDADPEVLWAGGVPWDLRASGDRPIPAALDPGTPHLHTALIAPNPAVPTPAWDAFVATVLPDPEVRRWALRVLSVGLTGHSDAVLPILYGPERSGKTTLVSRIVRLLGSYAHAVDAKLLGGDPTPSMVFTLKGRRLAFIDEGPRRGHTATERLKQLTGGGQLVGARKFRDEVTFDPTHTLVMTTNDEPLLTDPAVRARLRIIPCQRPEEFVRPAVQAMAAAAAVEGPGVLAALMRSAAAYLADGDSVSKASAGQELADVEQEIADEQDPVRRWVETQMTIVDKPLNGLSAGELLEMHCAWLQGQPRFYNGAGRSDFPTPNMFGRRLSQAGVLREKHGGRWMWGLRPRLAMVPGVPTYPRSAS